MSRPLRVVVCGTTFGQFYLAALAGLTDEFELVGLLSRGSAQSRSCARRHGVPLYVDPDDLPADVDVACVVVRSGVTGGAGGDLARRLLVRGIHVLQEQPVHHDDVAGCLQVARRHGVAYLLGDLYVHLPPARHFAAVARTVLAHRPARHVRAACAIQVAFPLVHLLAEALGGVRPWHVASADPAVCAEAGTTENTVKTPFSVVTGSIAGTPVTLTVHHEIDPDDPDNHLGLLQEITVDTDAGRLALADTHGPATWAPRLHIPDSVKDAFDFDTASASHLEEPSLVPLDPAPPSYRRILAEWWPAAIGADLLLLQERTLGTGGTAAALTSAQYHLTLCRLWQDVTTALGYPALRPRQIHRPLPVGDLTAVAAAAGADRT